MRRPLAPLAVAAVVAVAGCGASEPELPLACTDDRAVARALTAAPDAVRLPDGTPLSQCVARASSDAELQSVGVVLTGAAERLADAATVEAQVQLGYLVGAARRGSQRTSGIQLELVRRVESAARRTGDSAALRRGQRAGEADG
jgi:hypothetical protein